MDDRRVAEFPAHHHDREPDNAGERVGLFIKLLLTVGATTALLVSFVPTIGRVAGAAETAGPELLGMRSLSYVEHAAFGLVFLLIAAVLAMYKPRGVTRYWLRNQRTQRHEQVAGRDHKPTPAP